MKNLFSVARCCCGFCEDCCSGAYPNEFDVEITLRDWDDPARDAGLCDTCEDLGGTFTAVKQGSLCLWIYDSTFILSETCLSDDPYDLPIKRKVVEVSIVCITATQYQINVTYTLYREASVCPGNSPTLYDWDKYNWSTVVAFDSFACDGVSNYGIPRIPIADGGIFFRRYRSCGRFDFFDNDSSNQLYDDIEFYCENYADAKLTAVP